MMFGLVRVQRMQCIWKHLNRYTYIALYGVAKEWEKKHTENRERSSSLAAESHLSAAAAATAVCVCVVCGTVIGMAELYTEMRELASIRSSYTEPTMNVLGTLLRTTMLMDSEFRQIYK